MHRISLDKDIRSLSDFRSNVSSFIKQVHETKRPLVITQHGKSTAILMDVSEYERMIDKFELIREIETSTKQINDGQGIPHDLAYKRLKNRIQK